MLDCYIVVAKHAAPHSFVAVGQDVLHHGQFDDRCSVGIIEGYHLHVVFV